MGSLNPENRPNQELDDSGYVQDASASEASSKGNAQLLDLSDDVLLCILQYLTPRDLKALGHTCPRLGVLICDRTLWTRVDHRTTPVGQQRLRWLLTHCLGPATTELKLSGYANKFSRCLGIQDLQWPEEGHQEFIRGTCIESQEGADVEHFLLRMWYPHLPRFAVSPRWPDKAEAESKKAAEAAAAKAAAPHAAEVAAARAAVAAAAKAAEAAATNAAEATEAAAVKPAEASSSSDQKAGNPGPSGSKQNPGKPSFDWSIQNYREAFNKMDWGPDALRPSDQNRTQNCGESDQKSSSADSPNVSGMNLSSATENPDRSESKNENKSEYLFEDNVTEDCKGPQFTLSSRLMRDLRKTCVNLTSLALEYCNLDYKTTNLRHFPTILKKLSLRGSRCYNLPLNTSFLGKVQQRLPMLEYLDVSECDWFEPASLMPLSKLPALTELYMRDCRRLSECVAYASLSTRYGFKKLRVFDVRGSPLADSEVSALGWLPLLEELYVAPPEEFSTVSEHTHTWADTKVVFQELDNWELEEPDYYKLKNPESEHEEDDHDDEPDNERQGDVIINNPWWAHERRIIVIQPNASRQELEQRYPPRPRQPANEEDENMGEAPRRPGERPPGPLDPQQGLADPQPGPANPRPGPAYPLPLHFGSIDIVPINPPRPMQDQPVQLAHFPGPVNPRPVPLDPRQRPAQRPCQGPANQPPGPSHQQPGPAHQQPGPSNPGEGPSKRRLTVDEAIDLAKRRRLEGEEAVNRPMPPAPPTFQFSNFPPVNPDMCPRLRMEDVVAENNPEYDAENEQPRPGCVRFRRHDLRQIMHIDVDIHRQSTIHIGSHVGYHLVSDSSLLRLGTAENENVNYIHIGRHGVHHGSESGSRPDRSNLRILSVTGYRNITDRSLEHLVTAAPYLLHIDFTETNVTERGVELFKAVRPDCDVIFSRFGRMM